MYKVLDEKVRRKKDEVERLYPHCKYLLCDIKDMSDIDGYLYSVSDSTDSFATISKKSREFAEKGVLCLVGGFYEGEMMRNLDIEEMEKGRKAYLGEMRKREYCSPQRAKEIETYIRTMREDREDVRA